MINDFIDKMKPDFSNIDEVYSELLIKANVNNIDFTELMFIDSFDFDKYKGVENLNLRLAKLSSYLDEKRKNIEWFELDFYNHYKKTNEFCFDSIKEYKINEENELTNYINNYKKRFSFILFKISNLDEIEKFQLRQFQTLEQLKNKQVDSYFIRLFENLINDLKIITSKTIEYLNLNDNSIHYECLLDVNQLVTFKNQENHYTLSFSDLFALKAKEDIQILKNKNYKNDDFVIFSTTHKHISTFFEKIVKLYIKVADLNILNDSRPIGGLLRNSVYDEIWVFESIKKSINYYLLKDTFLAYELYFFAKNICNTYVDFLKSIFKIDFKKSYFYDVVDSFINEISNIENWNEILKNYIPKTFNTNSSKQIELINYENINHNEINQPKENSNKQLNEIDNKHPEFKPIYWNRECFELFKYLYEEYFDNKTVAKLVHIFRFLKKYANRTHRNNPRYACKISLKDYKLFILKEYDFKITNTNEPINFVDDEIPVLNDLRTLYEEKK